MLEFIRTRLQQGMRTIPFPGAADLPERFRGLPVLNSRPCADTAALPTHLLAADEEAQADQIDLLLLQLRKRAIVLLPASLDEIERRLPASSALKDLLRRLRA